MGVIRSRRKGSAVLRLLAKVISKLEDSFVSFAMLSTAMVLFVNVVTRYFGRSFTFAEEYSRYMIIWITFVGGSICVRKGMHVGIDAFVARLSTNTRSLVGFCVDVIGFVFSVEMTLLGWQLTQKVFASGQLSPAMMIPMWVPYAGVPLGCTLMAYHYGENIVKFATGGYRRGMGGNHA